MITSSIPWFSASFPFAREHPSSFCPLLSERPSCFAYPCPEPVLFRNRLIPFFHLNVEWFRFVCESWDQKLVVCFYLNKICFLKKNNLKMFQNFSWNIFHFLLFQKRLAETWNCFGSCGNKIKKTWVKMQLLKLGGAEAEECLLETYLLCGWDSFLFGEILQIYSLYIWASGDISVCCVSCMRTEYRNSLFSGSFHLWSERQQLFIVVCCSTAQESTGWCCFPSSLHGWLY